MARRHSSTRSVVRVAAVTALWLHVHVLFLLLLLVVVLAPVVRAKTDTDINSGTSSHSLSNHFLHLLCLGDSLTQGVGLHGGYRDELGSLIQQHQHQGSRPIHFIGSQRHTCTPKQPLVPFLPPVRTTPSDAGVPAAVPLPHEGHCSFSSSQLLKELPSLLTTGAFNESLEWKASHHTERIGTRSTSSTANRGQFDDSVQRRHVVVVLLLVGHNDVFQVAKLCRVTEGTRLSAKQQQELEEHFAVDRQKGSQPINGKGKGSLPTTVWCALKHLSQGYQQNLDGLVRQLSIRLRPSPGGRRWAPREKEEERGGRNVNVTVLLGMNPPIGFPLIQSVLTLLQREWLHRKSADTDTHSVRVVPTLALTELHTDRSTGSGGTGTARGGGLSLPKWKPFTHTFDSTHPNKDGNRLLAQAWWLALEREGILKERVAEKEKEKEKEEDVSVGPEKRSLGLAGGTDIDTLPRRSVGRGSEHRATLAVADGTSGSLGLGLGSLLAVLSVPLLLALICFVGFFLRGAKGIGGWGKRHLQR